MCVCVRARARARARGGGALGAAHSRAPRPLQGAGGGGGRGGGGGGESGSQRPAGLKVTRLVQKTASRKEVTEDEWEKASRSQPLKHRVKKAGGGGSGRMLGGEAGVAEKTEHAAWGSKQHIP